MTNWFEKFSVQQSKQNNVNNNLIPENMQNTQNLDDILDEYVDFRYCYYSGSYNYQVCYK